MFYLELLTSCGDNLCDDILYLKLLTTYGDNCIITLHLELLTTSGDYLH